MITANKKKAATVTAFFDCILNPWVQGGCWFIVTCLTNVEIRALQYFRRYKYQQFGTIIHFDR